MFLTKVRFVILIFLLVNLFGLGAYAKPGPKLSVAVTIEPHRDRVTITSHDDRELIIQRFVVNKRVGEEFCDIRIRDAHPDSVPIIFPDVNRLIGKKLRFGDAESAYTTMCGNPIQIDVYTNLGAVSYKLK